MNPGSAVGATALRSILRPKPPLARNGWRRLAVLPLRILYYHQGFLLLGK